MGYEGPGVHVQDARRARCAGQSRRARLQRPRRRLLPPRLQRARHGADRAAHGNAARDAGRRQRGHAVGHVRHPEPAHGRAGRQPAARVGDAAPHRQPARSERSADHVRRRIVHRRAGGGGESRSGRVPHAAAHGRHDRRQRLQARALDRRRQGGGGGVRLGPASVTEAARDRQRC